VADAGGRVHEEQRGRAWVRGRPRAAHARERCTVECRRVRNAVGVPRAAGARGARRLYGARHRGAGAATGGVADAGAADAAAAAPRAPAPAHRLLCRASSAPALGAAARGPATLVDARGAAAYALAIGSGTFVKPCNVAFARSRCLNHQRIRDREQHQHQH